MVCSCSVGGGGVRLRSLGGVASMTNFDIWIITTLVFLLALLYFYSSRWR